jgi:hypothetical protein
VLWYIGCPRSSKSVESSSFGSEFIAMKQCCKYIRGLRYKLQIMGIPCEGPAYISGDNQSVLANTTIPDSVLKKKSQSIAYHFVHEGSARDEWRTAYVNMFDRKQASCCAKMAVDLVFWNVICITPGISHVPGHPGQNLDILPGYDWNTIRIHSQCQDIRDRTRM